MSGGGSTGGCVTGNGVTTCGVSPVPPGSVTTGSIFPNTGAAGHVQGSFFLPAADANRKKKFGYAFTAGEKLFRLVDSPTNAEDDAPFTTLAEDAFRCVGADEGSKTITKKIKIIRGATKKTPPSVGTQG